MIQTWCFYGKSTEQVRQYLMNHIPPPYPSAIKIYKPTRLLQNNPTIRPEILSLWTQWQLNRFLNDTIEFHYCGGGSRMRDRPRSGSTCSGLIRTRSSPLINVIFTTTMLLGLSNNEQQFWQ
uniref:Uncharacterized protein n=1 Tax=Onchocerca volvulus TaxID=6282 RepID=A0A2K6VP71_ONCVO